MRHHLAFYPALLALGLAACIDQSVTSPSTDGQAGAYAVGKRPGGGFDDANNVGAINGTQWAPAPWSFTEGVVANGPECWVDGFCAVGNIINPDFLSAGVLDIGALSNPDPNDVGGCIDNALPPSPSVRCYGLLSTTNFIEDITDNNIDDPVEIKTLQSGIRTVFQLDAGTGWALKFDYAVLTAPAPGGPDASATVYLDSDSDADQTFDQTFVALQVLRSDLEQGNVPLKNGGCGTHVMGGITSAYPLCTGWQSPSIDVSFLAGRNVRVRLVVDEGGTDPGVATSFAVDNLKFVETVLVTSLTASPNPGVVNSPVGASASFTDTELGAAHTAIIDWGDGTTSNAAIVEPSGAGPGTASATHNYASAGTYPVSVAVSDGSGEPGRAAISVAVIAAAALIDIRPGVSVNRIFLRFNLPIPVVLFGGSAFDVRQVAISSLRFGPDGARPIFRSAVIVDVNHDGFRDLLSSYFTRQTGIQSGDTEACLSGTRQGVAFQGCDAISTVP